MANVPLKTIKFPDLSDTYTLLQNDATLTNSGEAADAKVAGDKLNELDTRTNTLNGLVNYGYDTPYTGTASGGSSAEVYSLTGVRNKTLLTLNGTCGTSGTALRLQLNSVTTLKVTKNTSSALGDGITLTDGHKYRLRMHVISGTAAQANTVAWALPSGVQRVTGTSAVTDTATGDVYTDITYDAATYTSGLRALLFLNRATSGNTLTNWCAEFTIEDLTVSLQGRVQTIEGILDYLELTEQIDLSGM